MATIDDTVEKYSIDPTKLTGADVTGGDVATAAPTDTTDYSGYSVEKADPSVGKVEGVTGYVEPESTVEGRLTGLLSQDSDYMDRAGFRADQEMIKRGLLSSSMAVGATEAARIDAALPIAQSDAQKFYEQQRANQEILNRAEQLTAGTELETQRFNIEGQTEADRIRAEKELQAGQFGAQMGQQTEQFNVQQINEANRIQAEAQNKANFEILSNDIKAQLAGIDQEYAVQLQVIEAEFNLMQNMDSVMGTAYQQLIEGISRITSNPDLTEADAKARVDALLDSAGATFEFSNSDVISVEGGPEIALEAPVETTTPEATTTIPTTGYGGRLPGDDSE